MIYTKPDPQHCFLQAEPALHRRKSRFSLKKTLWPRKSWLLCSVLASISSCVCFIFEHICHPATKSVSTGLEAPGHEQSHKGPDSMIWELFVLGLNSSPHNLFLLLLWLLIHVFIYSYVHAYVSMCAYIYVSKVSVGVVYVHEVCAGACAGGSQRKTLGDLSWSCSTLCL